MFKFLPTVLLFVCMHNIDMNVLRLIPRNLVATVVLSRGSIHFIASNYSIMRTLV